ncbi:MAG: substrate-binding domain-containing protein [Caulobacteraceae bacterium]|nr:substrate-binding domain-containing protein [Caulobacteraceae bacterium]
MAASAFVAAASAMAGAAHAAPTQIFGGGGTLLAPYLRQAEDCYGTKEDLVKQGSFPYGAGSESFQTVTDFVFTGSPPTGGYNCQSSSVNPNVSMFLIGAGSGNGSLSIFTHDETLDFGTTNDGGHTQFTSVQYAEGDFGVGPADVAAYQSGGNLSTKAGDGNTVGVNPGCTAHYCYANPTPQYGNFVQFPISVDPVAISYAPIYEVVTDASDVPTYYKLHINKPNTKDNNGGLLLDMPTVCAIFNGAITNWNHPLLKALNGGVKLEDPSDPTPEASWSVPIELTGRSDSSGTTSILYRALAAQCGTGTVTYVDKGISVTYTNNFATTGGKTLPGALNSGNVYNKALPNDPADDGGILPTAGKFTTAAGNDGVAKYVAFTYLPPASTTYIQGRIGYNGTDYVLPYSLNNGLTYGLNVANIALTTGAATGVEPTVANALLAFGTGSHALLPPQTQTSAGGYADGSAGHTVAANSHGTRTSPQDWVEPITTTVTYVNDPSNGGVTDTINTPLADPNHNIPGVTKAYPIVGTSNMYLNTCFASSAVTTAMIGHASKNPGFLTYYLGKASPANATITDTSATTPGLLVSAGLAVPPTGWLAAIYNTFVTPVTKTTAGGVRTDTLNLNILQAGTGPASGTGSQCNAVSPGA